MAAPVPGGMEGEEADDADMDEDVEEIDDHTGLPVERDDAPPEDVAGSPRRLSPHSKARPHPPAHSPPAHRRWEARAGSSLR
eukprot:13864002-Alexandrium_andersonii.AAC.1